MPEEQRRYKKRNYNLVQIRTLFEVPNNEMVFDLCYDKNNNRFVLRTLLDLDVKEGDL